MATATLNQVRSNLPEGFEIVNTISNAVDIPEELFVYKAIDDEFSHVASLTDFSYPITNTVDVDYYRKNTATKLYADVVTALEFANHVKYRIDELLKNYVPDMDAFPGTYNYNLPVV